MTKKQLTPTLESYLETIYDIETSKQNGGARLTDIAGVLDRSKASVNTAIKSLAKSGYIKHEHYGNIELTESGRDIAKDLAQKHTILSHFLIRILGIDEFTANEEACRIEHAMSDETARKFRSFLCSYCKKERQ